MGATEFKLLITAPLTVIVRAMFRNCGILSESELQFLTNWLEESQEQIADRRRGDGDIAMC